MARSSYAESTSNQRQHQAEIDYLVFGMDRDINGRPDLMMAELEALSQQGVDADSYRKYLQVNGKFRTS